MDGTAGNRRKARGASTGGGGPRPSLATVLESQRAFVSLCATILSVTFESGRNQHTHTNSAVFVYMKNEQSEKMYKNNSTYYNN